MRRSSLSNAFGAAAVLTMLVSQVGGSHHAAPPNLHQSTSAAHEGGHMVT